MLLQGTAKSAPPLTSPLFQPRGAHQKSKTNRILICNIVTLVFFGLFSNSAVAKNIRVQVKGIHETRLTNDLHRNTNINLKISGEGLEGSEGVLPVTIKKAYCDSGTKLKSRIKPSESYLFFFVKLADNLVIDQTVYLTSAKRSDRKIFLEGEIKVYTPQPSSIIALNFNNPPSTGKIIVQIIQEGDVVIHPFKTSAKLH